MTEGYLEGAAKADIDRKVHGEEMLRDGHVLIQSLWTSRMVKTPRTRQLRAAGDPLDKERTKVQTETKASVDQITDGNGGRVTCSLQRDISSSSHDALLGTYETVEQIYPCCWISPNDYINPSGIALVIQMLMEANKNGQKIAAFGLTRTSRRSSPWWDYEIRVSVSMSAAKASL